MTPAAYEILVGLTAAHRLGPKTIRMLLARFGGEEALVAAAARSGEPGVPASVREAVAGAAARGRRVLDDCAAHGVHVLLRGSPSWPERLECLEDVPEVLFVRGRLDAFAENAVGIVGSRECSPEAHDFTLRLAGRLAEAGWATISGLARGIDGAAHRGALAAGGETIAVLGCGPDLAYPEEHRDLHERIAVEGLLVSEFAPGMPPVAGNFPRRNRILAALSQAVVVVECRMRSGALVTCRHAIEHGKEIFVVPGWPDSPLAAGPLQLLRDGARAIRGADDLLEDLGGIGGGPRVDAQEEVDVVEEEEALDARGARERAARRELLGEARPRRTVARAAT